MFGRLCVKGNGCSHDSVLSDRFHVQRLLLDFDREASTHLDDYGTEELLARFAKVYSESSIPLSVVGVDRDLVESWRALNAYLRPEMCGGCVEHFILAFQMISSALVSNPNCVYLLFTPVDETSDFCPIIHLCKMLRRTFFGQDVDSVDFRDLLSCIDLLQARFTGNGIKDEFVRSLEEDQKTDLGCGESTGDAEQKEGPGESSVVSLLVESLELLQLVLKCIDDLTFMYGTDFRQTENFSNCIKAVLETYFPIFQAVLSSRRMVKLLGRETDCIKETRILVLRIFERMALVLSNTDLLPVLLQSLGREAVGEQGTIFESLMDILSPDFPSWYTSRYRGLAELKNFIFVLQLQFAGLLFLKSLCDGLDDSSSVADLFLAVRRHHIPFDDLPDFISKSSYWFSDVRDRLNFDRENSSFGGNSEHGTSLPQYVNSIFSNLFYRIAAVAFHNGLKLQQNMIDFSKVTETMHESITGSTTLAMKRLHSLKTDIFTVNVQIIALIITSVVSVSGEEVSKEEELKKSCPCAEAVSALHLFLVWICEFVFDYKSKIPQLYHILEEINLIKIRLPILHNAFNREEHSA